MKAEQIVLIVVAVLGSNALFDFIKFIIEREDKTSKYVTKDDIDPLHRAMVLILGEKLEKWMNGYIEEGSITTYQFKKLTLWFEVYEANGGNDNIHTLYEKCKTLL